MQRRNSAPAVNSYPVLCSPAAIPLMVAPRGYSRLNFSVPLLAAQKFHLNQAHGIDVRIAQRIERASTRLRA
jgi:hypothetical protein